MQNIKVNSQPVSGAGHKTGALSPQGYHQQVIPMATGQGNAPYISGYPAPNNLPNQKKSPTAILTNQTTAPPSLTNEKIGPGGDQNGSKESAGGKSNSSTSEPTDLNDSKDNSNLANTKEKTPMCLLNELARYNKISHQYMLVDEEGPAHQKLFHVKLKLGEEEYSSSGQSIKKAQHSVAALALEKTSFPKPPPKPQRDPSTGGGVNIMPTVELNAVAMRRGEIVTYKPIEPRHSQYYHPPNFDFRGMYNQRYRYPRPTRSAYVSLKVGQREFIGEGPTHQAARHMAAIKALRILKNLPPPPPTSSSSSSSNPGVKPDSLTPDSKDKDATNAQDELKSEISLVHEIGLKCNMPVNFEVFKECGPPHMKTFFTRCTVGEKVTEGEGNSKRLSKKNAAELMLEELKKLPSVPSLQSQPRNRQQNNKKKNRNLIKLVPQIQKGEQNYGLSINPISRLLQITQAQKKKEPVFTLIGDHGVYHRREFVMEVQVDGEKCSGVGHNKKLAKRNAAEAMLHHLGFSQTPPQPSKSAIKSNPSSSEGGASDKKVTFVDNGTENGAGGSGNIKAGRQLVPGLLLIPDSSRHSQPVSFTPGGTMTDDNCLNLGRSLPSSQSAVRPEQTLRELAQIHNFELHFDDFAGQSNKKEHLSRLTLCLNPTQILHGSGLSVEGSHDHAASAALQYLSKLGLTLPDSTGDGSCVPATTERFQPSRKGGYRDLLKQNQ